MVMVTKMKNKPPFLPMIVFVVVWLIWLTVATASLSESSSSSTQPLSTANITNITFDGEASTSTVSSPSASLFSSLQVIYGAAHIQSSFTSLSTFQNSMNNQTNTNSNTNTNEQQSTVGNRVGCIALADLTPPSSSSETSQTATTTQQLLQQALQQPSSPIQPLFINDTHICYSTDTPVPKEIAPHLSLDFLVPAIMKGRPLLSSLSLFPISSRHPST